VDGAPGTAVQALLQLIAGRAGADT